ncbi:MAG: twin-arginine translocase TatA/TatE family subunit [Myxococcota bacterium]
MFGLGMQELIVIFLILLLMFGASRLPGIAAGLGGAVHTFRKSLKGDDEPKALDAKSQGDVVPKTESSRDTTSA